MSTGTQFFFQTVSGNGFADIDKIAYGSKICKMSIASETLMLLGISSEETEFLSVNNKSVDDFHKTRIT